MNMTQRRKVAELIARRVYKFKAKQYSDYQITLKEEHDAFDASPPTKVSAAVSTINDAIKTIIKANTVLEDAGFQHKDNLGYNIENELYVKILSRNRPESKLTEPNFDDLDERIEALEMRLWLSGDLEAEVLMLELAGLLK